MTPAEAKERFQLLEVLMAMLQDSLGRPLDLEWVAPLCRDITTVSANLPLDNVQEVTLYTARNMVFDAVLRYK